LAQRNALAVESFEHARTFELARGEHIAVAAIYRECWKGGCRPALIPSALGLPTEQF
jgi:hypothetical protein